MKITKHSWVTWCGGIRDGQGAISTVSGALKEYPYGFASRFEDRPGSSPEELIAAAHASCFTMALSLILGDAGLTAAFLETSAQVGLEQTDDGFEITAVHLDLKERVPDTDQGAFETMATRAKSSCPVSKLIKAEITLVATLVP